MSVTPDESLPLRVRATLPEAEARAGEAWARLRESGSSSGAHPLSGLLDNATPDGMADDQTDVA